MATLKWCYDTDKWYTLYKRPFHNIVEDIKRIYKILGRVAKYLGNRCRRDKNLYDLDSAEDARYNLELINDCSPEANRLGISAHHHDSRHLRRDLNLSDLKNAKSGRFNLGLTKGDIDNFVYFNTDGAIQTSKRCNEVQITGDIAGSGRISGNKITIGVTVTDSCIDKLFPEFSGSNSVSCQVLRTYNVTTTTTTGSGSNASTTHVTTTYYVHGIKGHIDFPQRYCYIPEVSANVDVKNVTESGFDYYKEIVTNTSSSYGGSYAVSWRSG